MSAITWQRADTLGCGGEDVRAWQVGAALEPMELTELPVKVMPRDFNEKVEQSRENFHTFLPSRPHSPSSPPFSRLVYDHSISVAASFFFHILLAAAIHVLCSSPLLHLFLHPRAPLPSVSIL